ncbi:required for meiotic nuclear division 5 homolog B [Homo sapiens]|uniref:Required for meiotic nuclear division 5 homolog B n=1 Tax=Homo sapiens TaxID=9606 RepID=D6R9A2_HUMAN|nr:required for meiotic nuclear division 5-like B [Homo sapiens]KAI4024176.1 required for meiotic nuclear division 5 homolog B [Homo sapiens]
MEQCACVERELDKVLQKFLTYGQHCERSLEELLHYVGQLRAELASAVLPEDQRYGAETGFGP